MQRKGIGCRAKTASVLFLTLLLMLQPLGPLLTDGASVRAGSQQEMAPVPTYGFVDENQVVVFFAGKLDATSMPDSGDFVIMVEGHDVQTPSLVWVHEGDLLFEFDELPPPEVEHILHYVPSDDQPLVGSNGLQVDEFMLVLHSFTEDAVDEEILWPDEAEVVVDELGPTYLNISWEPASGEVHGYRILIHIGPDMISVEESSQEWIALDNLEPGGEYELTVHAVDAAGHSVAGPSVAVMTPEELESQEEITSAEDELEDDPVSAATGEDVIGGEAPAEDQEPGYTEVEQLVVSFEPGFDEWPQLLKSHELAYRRTLLNDALLLDVLGKQNLPGIVEALRSNPVVRYAHPNYILSADGPNDPLYPKQWGLYSEDWVGIDAPGGWQRVRESLDGDDPVPVVVAVIDTGVDHEHEDLTGRVLPGYDATVSQEGEGAAADVDPDGHGTRVAGIIAAVTDNEKGIAGVAGQYPVSVLPVRALDENREGTVADVADAILWAADWLGGDGESVSVINLSLGERLGEEPEVLRDAVEHAVAQGILVVASAGNDGRSVSGYYPAAFTDVVSVTGAQIQETDGDEHLTRLGNWNADVIAPAGDIWSTVAGDEYGKDSGTSYAAPFASGTAALVLLAGPDTDLDTLTLAITNGGQWVGNWYLLNAPRTIDLLTMEVPPPTNPRALNEYGIVNLWWEEPQEGDDLVEYVVYRDGDELGRVDAGVWWNIPNLIFFEETGLELGVDYHYAVRSVDVMERMSEPLEITAFYHEPPDITTAMASVPTVGMPDDESDLGVYMGDADISADGRFILFTSHSTNLVEEDTHGVGQLYLHDRHTGETMLITRAQDGTANVGETRNPAISANGRYIVFDTREEPNLLDDGGEGIYIWDRETEEMVYMGHQTRWSFLGSMGGISDDGRFVVFQDWDSGQRLYRYDRDANETGVFDEEDGTELYEIGAGRAPHICREGRRVVFESEDEVITGIPSGTWRAYHYDFLDDELQVLSVNQAGEPQSGGSPHISSCGRYVVFSSGSDLLGVSDHWGTYWKDMKTGDMEFVSVNSAGIPSMYGAYQPRVSEGGRFVASISSWSTDLTVHGTPGVFLHDRLGGRTVIMSVGEDGYPPEDAWYYDWFGAFALSDRGLDVAYVSTSPDLDGAKTSQNMDVFVSTLGVGAPEWPPGSVLEASEVGATYVRLSWSPALSAAEVVAYRIFQDGEPIDDVEGDVLEYDVTGLVADTEYTFEVYAADDAGQWSEEGLSLAVSTLDATEPGEASLSVSARPGGQVDLMWDPAPLDGSPSGYRIYRAPEDGDFAVVADVDIDTTGYTDESLAADALYSYRVDVLVDAEDQSQPHTVTAEVTTPPMYITEARWRSFDYHLPTRTMAMEGEGGLILLGEPNREASALVRYLGILDGDSLDEPIPLEEILELVEDSDVPGDYAGSFTLPAGAVELTEIMLTLEDGHGGMLEQGAAGPSLPINIQGGIAVEIHAPEGTLEGDLLTAWSEEMGHGASLVLDGPGSYSLSGLPASDDYRVRIQSSGGLTLAEVDDVHVSEGVYTDMGLEPRFRASLQVRVVCPEGDPLGGVLVSVSNSEDEQVAVVSTDADGWTKVVRDRLWTLKEATVDLLRVQWPYHQHDPIKIIPTDLGLKILDVTVDWHPIWLDRGYIEGYVRDDQGNTLGGTEVRATSGWDHSITESVIADEDGRYRLMALPGRVTLSASLRSSRTTDTFAYHNDSIEILENEELTHNITAVALRRYVVAMDSLEIRYPDGRVVVEQPVDAEMAQDMRFQVAPAADLPSLIRRAITTLPGSRNPIEIYAPPGVPLNVSVDGRSLGMTSDDVTRMTGDDGRIGVSFVVDKTAGTFIGQLEGSYGDPYDGIWSVMINRLEYGRPVESFWTQGHGSTFEITVPEPGEYSLRFSAGADGIVEIIGFAQAGDIVIIPTLRFQAGGAFIGSDNTLRVWPMALAHGGVANVHIAYRNHADDTPAQDAVLRLDLAPGIEPVQGSVVHSGSPADAAWDGDVMEIPVGNIAWRESGYALFQVQMDKQSEAELSTISSQIRYRCADGNEYTDGLGSATLYLVPSVSISSFDWVYQRYLMLHGRAPGGTLLTVYDSEMLLGQVRVASNGYWSLEVTLPDRGDPWWHELKAVAVTEGGEEYLSPEMLVLYDGTQARVTRLSFRQDLDAWPEMSSLAARFQAAGEWEHVDIEGGVPRFPRQMLAGFPFQFELSFNAPDAVDDVTVFVDGEAGGEADLSRSDDESFTGIMHTARDAPWVAGMIHAEYRTTEPPHPTWAGTVSVGDSEIPQEGHDDTLDGSGVRYSARTPYEAFGGDLIGDYTLSLQAGYPGTPESPIDVQNLTWFVDGNGFALRIEGYIPLSDFIAADSTHPEWPEGSRLIASEVEGDAVVLEWDPAADQLWVDTYRIYQDGAIIGEVPGDVRRYTVSGLTAGESYTFRVDAGDPADRWCDGGPELTLTAGDAGAAVDADTLLAFRTEADERESEREAVMRAASSTFERLKTVNRWTGRIARPVNLLDWGRETAGLGGEFDRLDGLLEGLGACVPAGDLGSLDDLVGRAKEALVLAQVVEGATIGAAFAAAATGVGLPGSAALTAAGLASGWAMRRAARNAEDRVQEEVDDLRDQFGECEDPEDDPPRVRQYLADPAWKIDPSGYVYEVTEDNRVPGVTAVVFRSDSDDGPWEVWDSDWYGEINPQETDLDGRYGWDVPPDWWMVFYEKDGYEPAYSDALPVPPPHFDVNIPLKWLGPPSVEGINAALDGEAVEVTFSRHMCIDTLTPSTIRLFDADGEELSGTIGFAPGELVANPHEEGDEETLSLTARFEPEEELPLGAEYRVLVNSMVQSYAGVPMGEDHEETVVVRRAHEVTVEVQPTDGGWVVGDGIHGDGDEVILVATPATGHRLVSWTEAGTVVGTDEEYTFTLTEDRELVANFALKEYALTMEISHGEGSVIPAPGTHILTHGEQVQLQATPAPDWRFSNWTRNVADRKSPGTTIVMHGDETVAADFRPVLCVTGVSIREGDISIGEGEAVQLTAEVHPSSALDQGVTWSSDDESVVVVDADGLVTAVAEGAAVITVTTDDGGFTAAVTVTVADERPSRRRVERVEEEPEVWPYASEIIDPEVGGIVSLPGILTLTAPIGTSADRFELSVKVEDAPEEVCPPGGPVDGLLFEVTAYLLSDEGDGDELAAFDQPVTVEMTYEAQLSLAQEKSISVHYYHEQLQGWIPLATRVDTENKLVMTYIDGPAQLLMCMGEGFIDIGGHWAENHVLMLNQLGIVEGYPDSAFRPDEPVTREQFAKMLVESGDIDVPQQSHRLGQLFGDADKVSDWARPYVKAATASGLIEGFKDDTFRPLNNVNRVQVAVMLSRALGLTPDGVSAFLDVDEIPQWGAGHVAALSEYNVVRGYPVEDGEEFRPFDETTRAEAAVFLTRYLQLRLRR